MNFDQFFNAIAMQESGGNYSAVNGGSGALGKYQIMPANVPYWSQKYLGTRWTPSQFLSDPRKQDALARAVLQDYYNRYGARGAASAWYSGQPQLHMSTRPQPGGPSIKAYVDQVLGRVGSAPSGGSGTGMAGGSNIGSVSIWQTDDSKNSGVMKPDLPQPAEGSGMGAVSAPGVDAVTGTGAEAVGSPGAQAVGAIGVAPERAQANPTAPEPQAPEKQGRDWVAGDPGWANSRRDALFAAEKMLGLPYVWGGGGSNGPSRSAIAHGNFNDVGFDCSGLVQYALAQAGITAPRLSWDQLDMGPRTSMDQLKPGDLVGFNGGSHIAIWLGDGVVLEAPSTGKNVRKRRIGFDFPGAFGVSLQHLYQ